MGLGGVFPRTLNEQIELLKSRQKVGEFAHTLNETGFALTGQTHKSRVRDLPQSATA